MIKNNQNNKVNPIPYFLICLITSILLDLFLTNHILHDIFISTTKSNLIDITYVQNTGAAFSYFQHSTLFLIVISVVAVIAIIFELFKDLYKYSFSMHFASAMLVAGILCNTWERVHLGYVRDFINLKFVEFPVFNISDILINLGVLAIIFLIITKKYKRNV